MKLDDFPKALRPQYPSLEGLGFEDVRNGLPGTSRDEVPIVSVTGKARNIYGGPACCGQGLNLPFFQRRFDPD